MMIPLSEPQLQALEKYGNLSMRIRDALLLCGVALDDVEEVAADAQVRDVYQRGKLRSIEETTEILKREASTGNVSAAKLILGRPNEIGKPLTDYGERVLRKRISLHVDVVKSVEKAFAKQRRLLEECDPDA